MVNLEYFLSVDTDICYFSQEADSGGRVLVHCVAGVSRSVAVVLGYLVRLVSD